jgi:hypothetical protein
MQNPPTPTVSHTRCARNAAPVTTDDANDLPALACFGLYVGGTGDVKVDMVGSGTVTFKAVPAGTHLHIQARRVYLTGTTATLIVALF